MRTFTNKDVESLARTTWGQIQKDLGSGTFVMLYGVPRGGIPAAMAVATASAGWATLTDFPEMADVIIDDLVDSGATQAKFKKQFPEKRFYSLFDKSDAQSNEWIVFPWEGDAAGSFEDNVIRMLQFIGEDASRGGLADTPTRVAKAWMEWCSGYHKDPASVLKVFEDGAEKVDEMVVVRNINFYSHCEHHLTPFFGTVTIGYVPNGKIVGLSKLARLVKIFSRRLQVQERLTNQIADALNDNLTPLGVGVVVRARHLCMESRGADIQGSDTITSALRGCLKDKPEARAEFMQFVGG